MRVLFVCLGNICRSPSAEGVFTHLLATEGGGLRVVADSAGTGDYHIGSPPDARAQRAALRRGIDLSGLRARQLRDEDFREFDWILAMDRRNLADILERQPPLVSVRNTRAKIGLLMDFAPPPAGVRSQEIESRTVPRGSGAAVADVPDPYFGGQEGFEQVLDLTTAACRGLIQHLRASAGPAAIS